MGGINLPGIDWVQDQGKGRADEEFLDLVEDCFFIWFVDNPIRSSRVLDLSLGTNSNMVKVEVEQHFWTSDHNIVCVSGFC